MINFQASGMVQTADHGSSFRGASWRVSFWPDLGTRRVQPELMDDPSLQLEVHHHALNGLARVNRVTRTHRLLWAPILRLSRETGLRTLNVLDLACGRGDLLLWLKQRAARSGITLNITGCDLSPVAVDAARQRARQQNMEATFVRINVLEEELAGPHHAVICSLFLHHLETADVVALLKRMARTATHLVAVQDLIRSRWGYLMAWLGTRILTRSKVVHVDGPRSVAAAFTCREAAELAERAGLAGAAMTRRWPARFILTCRCR